MNIICRLLYTFLILGLFSCAGVNKNYSPVEKYASPALRSDFQLLRNILESKHPSLYWYTSKDSMEFYFQRFYDVINDSMTEQQFAWQVLAPLVDKIHCGHTSVSFSKQYVKWMQGKKSSSFPLYFKVWSDTMAVIGNLNVKDSLFKRGTLVTSINGVRNQDMIRSMFDYLPEDGHANNINFIRMSANFPYYHRNIYGLSKNYRVTYLDSTGKENFVLLPLYSPAKDSSKQSKSLAKAAKIVREKKILRYRSLVPDSSGAFSIMNLNSFTRGHLRHFFRQSFKAMKNNNVQSLVLDLRNNGGGKVGLSTLLTKYIANSPFRVADSLFAKAHTLAPYTRYIKGGFLNTLELLLISKKKSDGMFHNRWLEKQSFHPKKNKFNGDVYVLTSGPTFSASALFCNAVKGQPNVKLAGEETGGGWYGNSGIMIPDITLPNTKLRVRLPLFRLVQYHHIPEKGSGIVPDIYIGTSYEALLKGYDKKMKVVRDLILSKKVQSTLNANQHLKPALQ